MCLDSGTLLLFWFLLAALALLYGLGVLVTIIALLAKSSKLQRESRFPGKVTGERLSRGTRD